MDHTLKQALSHILWIGGATDAGKSTAAKKLAERYQLQTYHYDQYDGKHHERLAQTMPIHHQFVTATLDERWVDPAPPALLQRSLRSFKDRFPLVIEDLLAYSKGESIVAEGFGFLPELLSPILTSDQQAIWLVPTAAFKQASITRRGKPSFGHLTRDPQKAKENLVARDQLLAKYIKQQVSEYSYRLHEIDGSESVRSRSRPCLKPIFKHSSIANNISRELNDERKNQRPI